MSTWSQSLSPIIISDLTQLYSSDEKSPCWKSHGRFPPHVYVLLPKMPLVGVETWATLPSSQRKGFLFFSFHFKLSSDDRWDNNKGFFLDPVSAAYVPPQCWCARGAGAAPSLWHDMNWCLRLPRSTKRQPAPPPAPPKRPLKSLKVHTTS